MNTMGTAMAKAMVYMEYPAVMGACCIKFIIVTISNINKYVLILASNVYFNFIFIIFISFLNFLELML